MSTLPRRTWLSLFHRVILRHCWGTPGQTAAIVALLAVGVGVFLSVRLANRAAVASFGHFTEVLTGTSDWVVTPAAGSMPLEEVAKIRQALGAEPVHLIPLVEVVTAPPKREGEAWGGGAYTLLGVDLFAAANLDTAGAAKLPWRELGDEGKAWASASVLKLSGGVLELVLADRVRRIALAGPMPAPPGQAAAPERLLVTDLDTLLGWLGRPPSVDRVEVLVEAGPRLEERREHVGQLLTELGGSRWRVEAPGARQETAATMTEAFRLNLTVLSLIALLVGLYLIGQTLDGTVVRRRGEIATLRSLGVSELWIQSLWLAEAAVLGLAGAAAGLALGWAGAQGAVQLVGRTINALYFTTSAAEAKLDLAEALLALACGVAVCVLAAWGPARNAAQTPPAQLLAQHRGAKSSGGRSVLLWAAAFLLGGVLLSQLPGVPLASGSQFPLAGHVAAFAWIIGAGLLAGPLLARLARLLRPRTDKAPAKVALAYLTSPTRRHCIALGGLVCATAMTAGMVVLVASFEASVRGWIEQALKADLYVSSGAAQSASAQGRLSPETLARLQAWPGVTSSQPHWLQRITLQGRPTQVHGFELKELSARDSLLWLERPRALRDATRHPGWASETFLRRFGLKVGDTVEVPSPSGVLPVELVASFSDYGNEQGALWLEFGVVRDAWHETGATSVALFTAPGVSTEALRQEIRTALPALTVYENRALRTEILRIFRQTFSLTYALEIIGLVVALGGLALTLVSMNLERRSDLTTLRALGFSRRELAAASRQEALLLAAVAAGVGVTLSLALGWLLVFVINRQSFGWTLQFSVPFGTLLALAAALAACGALTGHLVGQRCAALPADREEEA